MIFDLAQNYKLQSIHEGQNKDVIEFSGFIIIKKKFKRHPT